jgi:hypothetical protein
MPHWTGQRTSCVARPSTTDVAVGELNASDARKYGYREQAGICHIAVPTGLLNQIF